MTPHSSNPVRKAEMRKYRLQQEQTNHRIGDNPILGRPTVKADRANTR